jgi:hypothetical protein
MWLAEGFLADGFAARSVGLQSISWTMFPENA